MQRYRRNKLFRDAWTATSHGTQHPASETFSRAPSTLEGGQRLGIYYVPSLAVGQAEGLPGQE